LQQAIEEQKAIKELRLRDSLELHKKKFLLKKNVYFKYSFLIFLYWFVIFGILVHLKGDSDSSLSLVSAMSTFLLCIVGIIIPFI